MAKNSVDDWSTNHADNTDVGGTSIRGSARPSNVDDALRKIMAQLAEFRDDLPSRFNAKIPSFVDAATASIPASVDRVLVEAYDPSKALTGAAHYKRAATEPTHSLKFQNNSAWWEIDEAVITPQMAGALGDGTNDDASAIQAVMTHSVTVGSEVFVPAGTYLLGSRPAVTSGTYGLRFRGAGMGITVLKRSDFAGGVFRVYNLDGCLISDFSIDGNETAEAGGGPGFDGAHLTNSIIARIEAYDCKNSGVWVISGSDTITSDNVHITECYSHDNLGSGIQLQGAKNSGISKCRAVNVGLGGDSVSGVYFKVPVDNCYHTDNYAEDTTGPAFSVGSSFPGEKGTKLTFSGGRAKNCGMGIRLGEVENVLINNMSLGLSGEATTVAGSMGDGVRLELTATNVRATNIHVSGVAAGRAAARFVNSASNNYVELASFKDPASTARIAAFEAGCASNQVVVQPGYDTTGVSADLYAGTNNSVVYESQPVLQGTTAAAIAISSDAVTLRNNKVQVLRVDTEGSASADDLATISGGIDGQTIVLCSRSDSRDVTVKHNTGNIWLQGEADFVLDRARYKLWLVYDAVVSQWVEIGRQSS